MPSHVALLRGINLGSRNRVAMPALRALLTNLGFTDVATYIQSGNVVFSAAGADEAALAVTLERAIADQLGVNARVVVLTRQRLAIAVEANPFPDEPDPRKVHAVFLTGDPGPELTQAVVEAQRQAAERGSRDTAKLIGRTLYLHTPDGFGRSVLAERLISRTGGRPAGAVSGTARNWRTVTTLLAICEA